MLLLVSLRQFDFPSYSELVTLAVVSVYFLGETMLAATLLIRNKPTLTIPGMLGVLAVELALLLVLRAGFWPGLWLLVGVVLGWVLWGRKYLRDYLWVHGSFWAMQLAVGTSVYLAMRTNTPGWANVLGFSLLASLLIGWAYRSPRGPQPTAQ